MRDIFIKVILLYVNNLACPSYHFACSKGQLFSQVS